MTQSPGKQGDAFSIALTPNRADISAFVLHMEYDSAAVEQVTASLTGTSGKDYMTFQSEESRASLVYTAAENGLPKTGGIVLRFSTNRTFSKRSFPVHIEITDAAAPSAEKLLSHAETHTVDISFPPPPSSDSTLRTLKPPVGTLVPAFDPDITDYTLEVPFLCTTLNFETVPADGAAVRVNRKNLSSGGTTVDFRFTVTAEDNHTQTVYTVSVTRLKKEAASAADPGTSSAPLSSQPTAAGSGKSDPVESSALTLETSGSPSGTSASDSSTAPAAYIYPERETDPVLDRLVTAAIVLISVCTGAGIVCILQPRLSRSGNDTEPRSKRED